MRNATFTHPLSPVIQGHGYNQRFSHFPWNIRGVRIFSGFSLFFLTFYRGFEFSSRKIPFFQPRIKMKFFVKWNDFFFVEMMGGNKNQIKQPVIHHSSIPAHIRSLAQNLTGSKSAAPKSGINLNSSVVEFIAHPSPTKNNTGKKSGSKSQPHKGAETDRRSSPARHSPSRQVSPTTPVVNKRPTSLQTNVSSGYESEYQGSEAGGGSWGWTAAEVIWKWQNNNLKTKKVWVKISGIIRSRFVCSFIWNFTFS